MSDFTPSGIITMTTDFGHKGPFAAVMKGVILSHFRQAEVIDLAHDIPAHWPPEAGFWISRSYKFFPVGTVHIAIVDPGVGTERDIIAFAHDGHLFLAPDNGLLAAAIGMADSPEVFRLSARKLENIGVKNPSPTFHGRDIFAPVAAEIAAGRIGLADVSVPTTQWTPDWIGAAEVIGNSVAGVVITIDAFGNLITNIDGSLLDNMVKPVLNIAGHEIGMKITYGNASPGEFLALVNSFDVVEIARAEGSAANGLGVERGAPVRVADHG